MLRRPAILGVGVATVVGALGGLALGSEPTPADQTQSTTTVTTGTPRTATTGRRKRPPAPTVMSHGQSAGARCVPSAQLARLTLSRLVAGGHGRRWTGWRPPIQQFATSRRKRGKGALNGAPKRNVWIPGGDRAALREFLGNGLSRYCLVDEGVDRVG